MAVTGAARGASVEFSTWSSFADVLAAAREQNIPVVAVDIPSACQAQNGALRM